MLFAKIHQFYFSEEEGEDDSESDDDDEVDDVEVDAGKKFSPKVDEKVLKLKAQLLAIKSDEQSERYFH